MAENQKDQETGSQDSSPGKTYTEEYTTSKVKSLNFARTPGNSVILRNLNDRYITPNFKKYSKDNIQAYLSDPAKYEKNLRDAVVYIYGASTHFRRLIQYFVGLSDLAYVVSPSGYDTAKLQANTVSSSYKKTLDCLTAMNIREQFPEILTVCLREDVYYGTMWVTDTSIIIQRLDSDYCKIATIEDNVFNVAFNFSFFDVYNYMLEYYPPEFEEKYRNYQSNRNLQWQDLDSPTSFAIKCNKDIPTYAMPPFAGILRELYDLEDYKALKLSKTALENYALLWMKIPTDKDGEFLISFDRAKDFWSNMDEVTPEEVGNVLSPMDIQKIDFEKSNTGDTDTITQAEQNLFTAAGVSSLLFNNASASANALNLSIKVDQNLTFGIVKGLECMINRYLLHQSFGKKFRVTFLDVSPFNRKEMGDQYLKAAQYGLPTIMMYAVSQGLNQADVDCMRFLEDDVLDLKNKLIPLRSSNTMSAEDRIDSGDGIKDEDGNPIQRKEDTELTLSGEADRESAAI